MNQEWITSIAIKVAAWGGVFVALGVLMEVWSEKFDSFKNLRSLRRWRKIGHLGGVLVVIGVLIEVADAIHTTHRIDEAHDLADAANPTNQPLAELSAVAVVDLNGKMLGLPQYDAVTRTFVELNEAGTGTINLGSRRLLYASEIQPFNSSGSDGKTSVTYYGYNLRFRNDNYLLEGDKQVDLKGKPITAGVVMSKINWVRIYCPFIQPHEDIHNGAIELVINGGLKKRFKIPAQKTDTNIGGWANREGSSFYATNEQNLTR